MLSDAHFHGATSFQKAKICKMLYRPRFMSNQQVFQKKSRFYHDRKFYIILNQLSIYRNDHSKITIGYFHQ